MKKSLIVAALVLIGVAGSVRAVSENGFTLNVLHDGEPVKEIIEGDVRRTAIPFGSEYAVRLRNTNGRRCVAKVSIDGAPVSKMGNFVLVADGVLDLERFLDASLTDGSKFKFVSLDHPDVDDPGRAENGLIEVEFRLEKEVKYIRQPYYPPQLYYPPQPYHIDTNVWRWGYGYGDIILLSSTYTDCNLTSGFDTEEATVTVNCSATLPGATVEGGQSQQAFHKVTMDTEDKVVTLKLWLRGIK